MESTQISEQIVKVLVLAQNAPSGDNSQPWRFSIASNNLRIYNVPTADNHLLNVAQRGSLIAHGALIQNILLSAPHLGLDARVVLNPNFPDDNLVATISFNATHAEVSDISRYIAERHTNRNSSQQRDLDSTFVDEVQNTATLPDTRIVLIQDTGLIQQLSHALSTAEKVILQHEELHSLLYNDVVWSKKEEKRVRRGLLVDTLELPPPAKVIFRLAQHWSRMRILKKLGLPGLIAAENAKIYASSGAIGAVIIKNTDLNFVVSGQVLENIWLHATRYEYGFQPLNGLLFLHQNILRDNNFLSERLRTEVFESFHKIDDIVPTDDGYVISNIFRVGVPTRPASARSSKVDISELMV